MTWNSWLPPALTLIGILATALLGPAVLNRRHAARLSQSQANQAEATAAQIVADGAATLISKWQEIADRTERETSEAQAARQELMARASALEIRATNAERRAYIAESQAVQAERRAVQAERRASEAEAAYAALASRMSAMETVLAERGIVPPYDP